MSGLSTPVAWDNFDEITKTFSGKGTLHDTFGICYQNVLQSEEMINGNEDRCDQAAHTCNEPSEHSGVGIKRSGNIILI